MFIVTKLDIITLNIREALEVIQHLFQNNIKIYVLD